MPKQEPYENRIELLQGTLDLLILQTLRWGPSHGYGITQAMRASSGAVLQVDTGSMYPALHRLERQGSIDSRVEGLRQQAAGEGLSAHRGGPEAARVRALALGAAERSDRRHPEPGEASERGLTSSRFWRRSRDEELAEELRGHLDMARREAEERGPLARRGRARGAARARERGPDQGSDTRHVGRPGPGSGCSRTAATASAS